MARIVRRVLKWTAAAAAIVVVLAAVALLVAWFRSDNDCAERARTAPAHPMKAIVYCEYGGPEVVRLETIEKPVVEDDRVLVKVHAAAVNPLDWHFMRGTPYVMRLDAGLRMPKSTRLGVDFAGTVEEVGRNVTEFKPGDAVFGGRMGAFAEYVSASPTRLLKKPENISFEEAASVPVAAITALQALRDKGQVRPGQRVLINGASGGVGTFAVQIAKTYGAHVTGVCSTRNVELVRSLGADAVVDYTRQDFTKQADRYDVIIDMVGNHPLRAYRQVMKPKGTYVMIGGPSGRWIAPMDKIVTAALYSAVVKERFGFMLANTSKEDMTVMRDLMQAGKVKPVIDRRYSLAETAEAIRYLETGRARGKVVITVVQ